MLGPAPWNQCLGLARSTEDKVVQESQVRSRSSPRSRKPLVRHDTCSTPQLRSEAVLFGCRFPQGVISKSPFFPCCPTPPLMWDKAVQEIHASSLSMASIQLHLGLDAPVSCYLSQWLISAFPASPELPHLSHEGGLPRAPGFSELDLHTPPALLFLTSLSWLTFRNSC